MMWLGQCGKGEEFGQSNTALVMSENKTTKTNLKNHIIRITADGKHWFALVKTVPSFSETNKVASVSASTSRGTNVFKKDITSTIDKSGIINKDNDKLKVYNNWFNTPVWTSNDNTSQGNSFLITGCKGDEIQGITDILMLKATWRGLAMPAAKEESMKIQTFMETFNPPSCFNPSNDADALSPWGEGEPVGDGEIEFAENAVELAQRALPNSDSFGDNLGDWLRNLTKALVMSETDRVFVSKVSDKHMQSVNTKDREAVILRLTPIVGFILSNLHQTASPNLRKAYSRTEDRDDLFDHGDQDKNFETLRKNILEAYRQDGDAPPPSKTGAKAAFRATVPDERQEALALWVDLLRTKSIASDVSRCLGTTIPDDSDDIFECMAEEAFSEVLGDNDIIYSEIYEDADTEGKTDTFGSFVLFAIRHELQRKAKGNNETTVTPSAANKKQKQLSFDDDAGDILTTQALATRSSGGVTHDMVKKLTEISESQVSELTKDIKTAIKENPAMRRLLAAGLLVDTQAKALSRKISMTLVESIRSVIEEFRERLVELFPIGLATLEHEKATSLILSGLRGNISSPTDDWCTILGAEMPCKGKRTNSMEAKNAWLRYSPIAKELFSLCYSKEAADIIFKMMDTRVRRLNDETPAQPRPKTFLKFCDESLSPAIVRAAEKWQKVSGDRFDEADDTFVTTLKSIVEETGEHYNQLIQTETSEEAAKAANSWGTKGKGKGKGKGSDWFWQGDQGGKGKGWHNGKGDWSPNGKGKGGKGDGKGKGKGDGGKGSKGSKGIAKATDSVASGKAFGACRHAIDAAVNAGKDFKTQEKECVCTAEIINGKCTRTNCAKIHIADYGSRKAEIEAAKKTVKDAKPQEWKLAGGK